ncbi:RSM22 [Candida pseudojiufengensis]|uniref:RSM22 n=1 Tax=Candida pseudojiufengensis TaxID=497109 RepID=UPI002224F445|nr:RSM22 [Candida pseudojiufengensis]KAI5960407.1 RSM22 [Candida pseudojiufengensis]
MYNRQVILGRILPNLRRKYSLPHHNNIQPKLQPSAFDFDFIKEEDRSSKDIVKNYLSPEQVQIISKGETVEEYENRSPFRNFDGTLKKGENALEARLSDTTLKGRVDHSITVLPQEISKVIQNNILSSTIPAKLRERVVTLYQNFQKNQIQQAPSSELDCNAHIAGFFLQDYSHIRQVILELQKRLGKDKFNPKKVLDIGYGPATGIVALNEIMGDDWKPEEKDAYIVGRKNNEMKKRAKIILSRQPNENVTNQSETADQIKNQRQESNTESEYVGPIDVKKINILTKLRDTIPVTKKYDLIIASNSLLTKEYNFPKDVDENIKLILRLLSPNGHLILVERGNSVGFETIARARQIMIRPERFPDEVGKIPRPYISGSSGKPQHLKKEDSLITDDDLKFEKDMLAQLDAEEEREKMGLHLEEELNSKYGEVTEDELKFDEELSKDFEFIEEENESSSSSNLNYEKIDYHLKILAPCPNHKKCPLQLGDPKYYKIPSHKHRLNFCSFSKIVERPNYTMELKKGKKLAIKWDKQSIDGIGSINKNELKKLGGKGRPGGRDTEDGSYSYLIVERSSNDQSTLQKIENSRNYNINDNSPIDSKDINNWPRIIRIPEKLKKNVKLTVCSNQGNIEIFQIPKSLGKQEYHDARKIQLGDLWGLGKKQSIIKTPISKTIKLKLNSLYKTSKKTFKKEQQSKIWKKKIGINENEFNDGFLATEIMANEIENKRSYKNKGKKLDVNPETYEGK